MQPLSNQVKLNTRINQKTSPRNPKYSSGNTQHQYGTQEGVRGCKAPHPANASLRRQRRKVVCTGTGNLVPVPDLPSRTLLADPDNSDARRRLPPRLEVLPVVSRDWTHSADSRTGSSSSSSCTFSSSELTKPQASSVDELECAASSDLEGARTFALFFGLGKVRNLPEKASSSRPEDEAVDPD